MAEERISFCRICEPMCGIKVTVEQNRVVAIRGDRGNPLSKGWICRRGLAFEEIHNDPDRLRYPMRKGPHGWEGIPWRDAVREVASGLSRIRDRYGPEAVAVYMGNPMAFCTYGALAVPAFVRALGTSRFFTAGSQDANNKFAASQRIFGSPVIQPIPDLHHVRYLLVLGANPAVSGMSFSQVPRPTETLRAIVRRGGRIVVVDPRRTETARIATEHLFIEPDTDCFFLLSLLCTILRDDLYDRFWAARDARGFSALEELALQWPPERTASITGIPEEKTVEIAHALTGPEPAACYGSFGINVGRSGTLTYWLLQVLNILSGHFDKKGGTIVCRGVMDMGLLYRLSGLGRLSRRSLTGDFRPVMGTYPAALMAHDILATGKDRIRALVVVAGNPLLSVPNEEHLREALKRLDLLVCLDIYRNETGAFAHYLLPTTDFLEREDLTLSHTGLQQTRHIALSPKVVDPDGAQLEEWAILESLSEAMGLPLWGRLAARVRRLMGRRETAETALSGDARHLHVPRLVLAVLLGTLGEESLRAIRSDPRGILLSGHTYGRWREKRPFFLPATRVALAPQDLLREAWKLEGLLALRRLEKKPFVLIGRRERHTHNTWMHNSDKLAGRAVTNYLYIHPEDAAERGIADGEQVRVTRADGGSLEVPCRVCDELKRGVVALPHGWGHTYAAGWTKALKRPGVNVNRLTSDSVWKLEPIAGMAWLTGIPVEVLAVAKGKKGRKREERKKAPT